MEITATSWKTTSTGILLIIGGLVRIGFMIAHKEVTEEGIMTTVTTILSGVGLAFAKDFNKTGVPNSNKEIGGTVE